MVAGGSFGYKKPGFFPSTQSFGRYLEKDGRFLDSQAGVLGSGGQKLGHGQDWIRLSNFYYYNYKLIALVKWKIEKFIYSVSFDIFVNNY